MSDTDDGFRAVYDEQAYVRRDGANPFTAPVSGITPVAGTDLATRDYVDSVAAGATSVLAPVLASQDTPPGVPALGSRYRIIAVAAGAWVGREDDIAEWGGAAWVYTTPTGGEQVLDLGASQTLVYNGSAWVQVGTLMDHGMLQGLTDDDHTMYARTNGSRAFSANVSGVTCTAAAHLTRKDYVDGEIAAASVVDQAYADAADLVISATDQAYADAQDVVASAADQAYADGVGVAAVASAGVYTDAEVAASSVIDQAYADAVGVASGVYSDGQDAIISAGDRAYADAQDALHSIADQAYADGVAAAAQASAEAYADAAVAAADITGFGCMDEVQTTSPSTITLTALSTWYPWITASSGYLDDITFVSDDILGDYLLIGTTGTYRLSLSVSFAGSGSTVFVGAVYQNASQTRCQFRRKLGTGGDVGSASGITVLPLAAGDKIRVKFNSPLENTKAISIYACAVTVTRLK